MHITKVIEFDAAHRLPSHPGLCSNLHGHRYRCEVTLEGEPGADGLVMDFGVLKNILRNVVMDSFDHATITCEQDTQLITLLNRMRPIPRYVTLPQEPTAEVIGGVIFTMLQSAIRAWANSKSDNGSALVKLQSVRLYETPTSWVDVQS